MVDEAIKKALLESCDVNADAVRLHPDLSPRRKTNPARVDLRNPGVLHSSLSRQEPSSLVLGANIQPVVMLLGHENSIQLFAKCCTEWGEGIRPIPGDILSKLTQRW